ncbi:MAG: hypothetical protein M3O02_08810 [Acidobacteriota bacterium]|nr:hypothetical protein [Acidobacteriota bacterium]
MRQFDDPHVLKIVDYGTDERGAPYLVTPYCENGSLENAPEGTVIETRADSSASARVWRMHCEECGAPGHQAKKYFLEYQA